MRQADHGQGFDAVRTLRELPEGSGKASAQDHLHYQQPRQAPAGQRRPEIHRLPCRLDQGEGSMSDILSRTYSMEKRSLSLTLCILADGTRWTGLYFKSPSK